MKAIIKRRKIYAVLSAVGILLAALFIAIEKPIALIACAVACASSLIFLYRQNRLLYVARLICDNRILTVPSSMVTIENRVSKKVMEETVISTFGLLLGNKVCRWGCDGVHGISLRKVRLDREHIWLSFGVDDEKLSVELLHGMTDRQSVMEITQKIWRETGVQAEVSDW